MLRVVLTNAINNRFYSNFNDECCPSRLDFLQCMGSDTWGTLCGTQATAAYTARRPDAHDKDPPPDIAESTSIQGSFRLPLKNILGNTYRHPLFLRFKFQVIMAYPMNVLHILQARYLLDKRIY